MLKKLLFMAIILCFMLMNSDVRASNIDSSCIIKYGDELVVTIKFITESNKIDNYSFIYNNDDVNFELPIPSKVGYRFLGWYRDKEYKVKINDIINSEEAKKLLLIPNSFGCDVGNVETNLYAKWEKNDSCNNISSTIDIKYDTNGGNKIKEDSINIDETLDLKTPEKVGYIFWGWYLDYDLLNKIDNNVTYDFLNNNMNLIIKKSDDCNEIKEGNIYAKWVKKDLLAYYVIDALDRNLNAINKNV